MINENPALSEVIPLKVCIKEIKKNLENIIQFSAFGFSWGP